MIRKFLLIVFVGLASVAIGQDSSRRIRILEKLNFDQGEWKMFGISQRNLPHPLQDSLGDFFTKDVAVLKRMQSAWQLRAHGGFFACGYHYQICIVQNDTIEHHLSLNLLCQEICDKNGCYEFPESLLWQFYPSLKHLSKSQYEFRDLQAARKVYRHLLPIDTLLVSSYDLAYWSHYPGFVKVEVVDSSEGVNYLKMDSLVFSSIQADYPNEVFEIRKGSSSHDPYGPDTYDYQVFCSPSMGQDFKTFRVKEPWAAFDKVKITVHGLSREELVALVKGME